MLCGLFGQQKQTLRLSLNSLPASRHWKEIRFSKVMHEAAAIPFFDLSFHIHHGSLLQAAFFALAILA